MNTNAFTLHPQEHDDTKNMIAPFDSAQPSQTISSPTRRVREFLKAQWAKMCDAWFAMQLTHYGGTYSIERMLGLEEYTRKTSLTRVIVVSIGAPILVFGLVLCQESVPLQDPKSGWKVGYGFWVRVGFLGAAIGFAFTSQLSPWLGVPGLSVGQTLAYCLCKGVGFIVAGMAATEVWTFPVPFFTLSLSMVWPVLLLGLFRIVAGAQAFKQILSQREDLRRLNRMGALQSFLCAAYPVYQILFVKVIHTNYELPVLLLLPVFKLIMKIIFASAASHKEDLVPEQVIFTVDFFDAFYRATFMPNLTSTTLISVLALDFVQTAIELRELHQRTQSILARLHEAAGISSSGATSDLLAATRSLCYLSKTLSKQMGPSIRVRSHILLRISPQGKALLDNLDACSQSVPSGSAPHTAPCSNKSSHPTKAKFDFVKRGLHGSAVQPLALVRAPSQQLATSNSTGVNQMKPKKSMTKQTLILQEALELLFTSECLILTEYVEVVIPLCYTVFVMVMVHLPSAQYHMEMVGINRDNVAGIVSRMCIYALLELVSFVMLAVITKRNCGIHSLYQLGFVLETQMMSVLSKILLWMLFTLTYRIDHFGTFIIANSICYLVLMVICAYGIRCRFFLSI